MGFGKIFLEFNPVDIRRVVIRILKPPVAPGEEHVFLVRRDSRSEFKIPGINLRAQIPSFGPGTIRPPQSEVQVRFAQSSRSNGGEYHKGLIRSNARKGADKRKLNKPGPGIVLIRGVKNSAAATSGPWFGMKEVDTVVRC
jgi:hypothetical protein